MSRRNDNPKQRLFFALWPDDAVRSELARLASGGPRGAGRLVPAENLHLTLAFLGHLDAGTRACVEAAADGISAGPFELVFTRLGCWPRPRVLWAGTQDTPAALVELVYALRRGMTGCGLRAETRPYRAHVTLARKTRVPADFHAACEPVRWRADAFDLVESKTLSAGAHYRRLRRWPLGGGNARRIT